jgi:alkylation response protein AidB-like acyl-CoA dehydrogenase
VAVPHANVVGEVNDGWRVAMTTLMNERHLIGGAGGVDVAALVRLAQRQGRNADPLVRQQLAGFHAREAALRYLSYRARTSLTHGRPLGPESSVAKLANGLLRTEMADAAAALVGPAGTLTGAGAPDGGRWADFVLSNLSSRIGGGTDQVQRNIIAERVLGLPREPAVDRDVPFRRLPRS